MKTSKLPFVLHLLAALAILSGCGQAPKPAQVTLADLQITNAQASVGMTRCDARAGSKIRIEGTSNIHDWQVESPFIAGMIEAGTGFPTEPGQAVTPGKVEAKADVFIQVRALKSIEKDGKPYSDKMDEVMWEHLKETENLDWDRVDGARASAGLVASHARRVGAADLIRPRASADGRRYRAGRRI